MHFPLGATFRRTVEKYTVQKGIKEDILHRYFAFSIPLNVAIFNRFNFFQIFLVVQYLSNMNINNKNHLTFHKCAEFVYIWDFKFYRYDFLNGLTELFVLVHLHNFGQEGTIL